MVGSIIPSSRILINRMLGPVDWATTRLFVEYGPGVGTFTRPILELLGPDATLVTIDTNPDFTTFLQGLDRRPAAGRGHRLRRRGRANPRRARTRQGRLYPLGPALLDPSARRRPGDRQGDRGSVIRPGGAFLVYQFSPKVRDFIAPFFERIERGFEWVNVPPATLFWAFREPASN